MATASRVGTIDPMGKSRVYTDEALREVPAGSPKAAFVWKKSELDARRERRATLGLDKNDEALRAHIDSREAERVKLARRAAASQAELAVMDDALATAKAAEADAAKADAKGSKSTKAAKADDADGTEADAAKA